MPFYAKKPSGWTKVKRFDVKKPGGTSGTWAQVKKGFIKKVSGWVQFWPKSGPYTTTAPFFSSDTAGNSPLVYPIIFGETVYAQRGVWVGNGETISSYRYKVEGSTSGILDTGPYTTLVSERTMSGSYASVVCDQANFDGKYLLLTVTAVTSSNANGEDSSDNTETGVGYRIPVIRNEPEPKSGTTPSIIGVVTSLPTTLYYTSSWNGAQEYLPDSTRSSVKWYTATSGTYNTSNIATYGTEVTSGVTTSTPTLSSGIYTVTSSVVTPSTLPENTYYYAVDTQKNSGTDYSIGVDYGIKQFAVRGPLQTPPNPPTNLQRTLGNGTSKTFSWVDPVGGGTITRYEYRYTSPFGDSGWISNNLLTSVSITTVYGSQNVFSVKSVGPTAESSAVLTPSFTVPRVTTSPFMLTRNSTAAEIDWASNDQATWSLSLSPAGATSPYTGTTESLTTTPPTDLVGSTTYTPTLTITSSTGDTHTVTGTAFTTLAPVPGPPTNLQRTLGNGTNKTFTWDAPSSGTTPTSYEYNLSGAGWVSTGLTRSVSFTNIAGQNLTFLVRARSAAGPGTSVSTGQFTIPTLTFPAPSPVTSTSALFNWTSNYQSSYSLSIPGATGTPFTGNDSGTFYAINNAFVGSTTYTATMTVASSTGDTVSASQTFTTAAPVPGTPTNLQRTTGNGLAKTFTWSAPSGGSTPTGYEYQLNNLGFIDIGLTTSVALTVVNGANTFQVRAYNGSGAGSSASTGQFTPPVISSFPAANPVTSVSAAFNWTNNTSNQSTFSLSIPGATGSPFTGTTATTYAVNNALTPSTTYNPTLTITGPNGDTATTTGSSFTTSAAVPGPPPNLAKSAGNGGSKTFTWDAPAGTVTSYEVQINNLGYTDIGNVRTYSVTGLSGSNNFFVRAKNSTGTGSASSISMVIPTISTALSSSAVAATSATLSWGSTNQSTYSISIPGAPSTPYTGTSAVTRSITGLTANTIYSPSLSVISSASDTVSSSTSFCTLSGPAAITITNVTSNGFTASWSSTNATQFYVDIFRTSSAVSITGYPKFTTTTTSGALTGLVSNAQYTISVVGLNQNTVSGTQAVVNQATGVAAPFFPPFFPPTFGPFFPPYFAGPYFPYFTIPGAE